jgi:hypothetical protein
MKRVIVHGSGYTYKGWLISIVTKRSGEARYIIEDDYGRLFIHNAQQVEDMTPDNPGPT